ncbi:hsp90 co-chaperone Cdc37 [Coemansia guatemalensis]|uniref:Hsp90 chaperone protein kinase-targeting subunit n=1 Tax=Coemansia guatemalensis TaxID=2761395 RepID=A0A9W8LRA4_9FUNG|nr:hsp90 co-chaperone Cdc37 [Coemansia guatemalensis]
MPIDYSKWDNLELSDDSDVEVHPNIERGTFIRLRQRKIREERERRLLTKERAEALVAMNKDLIKRITELRDRVSSANESTMKDIAEEWEKDVEKSRAFTEKRDAAVKDGEEPPQPSEEEMLAALKARISDDLLKAAAKTDTLEDRRKEYTAQLNAHIEKLTKSLQNAEHEAEEAAKDIERHIDPDTIAHTGFDRSFVSKSSSSSAKPEAIKAESSKGKQTVTTDEILNPKSLEKTDSKAPATKEDDDSNAIDENGDLRLDSDSKAFASLTNMSDSMDFILKNLKIVSEEKTNQILGHAFTHELAGRKALAKQYVFQGLILTYILELGSSGVNMFFSRIGARGSAQDMFLKDVEARYKHIETRCKVIQSETSQNDEPEVESIQLQTDDPDAPIKISVPDESDKDEDPKRIELFQQLPKPFQEALKVGTIAELNKVLATIPGPEAERILEICGEGMFLQVDEEVIVDPNEQEGQDKAAE